jgi:hypothetical protein
MRRDGNPQRLPDMDRKLHMGKNCESMGSITR